MIRREEWHWTIAWAVALVGLATLPYLIAYLATSPDLFYTGFLSNPEDGNAYVAKMQQGWHGDWLYHLPYTAEPHQGEFLFTYYLLLGHLARWTGIPLILIFHLARAVNGFILLVVLYHTISHFFTDLSHRRLAFLLTALGSGLGWLSSLWGLMTVDLWVPEGYVFYSMFVNPHFPLAIALMLLAFVWSVTPWEATRPDSKRLVGVALCTVGLGLVQPFCLLTVGVTLLVYTALRWVGERRLPWREIASGVAIGAAGTPFALNAYLALVRNPAFAAWSSQNQTPSPPPWDYAIGYGVVLLLALGGAWRAARRRRNSDLFLLTWTLCTIVLLYAPFDLQRRLVMGLAVPLGILATIGWLDLPWRRSRKEAVVVGVVSLTHLFLIGLSLMGALTFHETLFLTRDERAAIQWLAAQAEPDALVIAAPDTGLYIPAWSGQRVFYGHRFDTANAEGRRSQLIAFFAQGDRTLLQEGPNYVLYGPREKKLNPNWQPDPTWKRTFEQGHATIYAVPGNIER